MIMVTPWLMLPHTDNDDGKVCSVGYEALTPTELEPEKASSYAEALNYAYEQPDIRNIAVTGPYGAGKSSVLKTWCKTKDGTLRVLTVSLADFDLQKYADDGNSSNVEGNAGEDKKTPDSVEKSIEYSILQQILYKNKKHELPHSRIDRISGVTVGQILQSASFLTGTMLLTGIALFFLAPDYVTAKLSLPETFSRYLLERPFVARLAGAAISMVGSLGLLLSQLHRIGLFDRKVSLDKVDILKGAVTTRASSPSLLNVYVDEIVYFFDSTRYDVVIFEDLDRFNNGRIFIKLREINQIINNCLSDRKPIKFIYAVRDDVFSSAESRTKFFDFVMPVIPVMDNQNAFEHFSNKFNDEEINEVGLSECIARIATFIPNMRVMHNITNEFRLYQNIVNNRENLTKLLAMIAYKNLCSEDYHGIDSKRGVLYNFIKSYIEHDLQKDLLLPVNNDLEESLHLLEILNKEKNTERQSLRRELLEPFINENHKHLLVFQAGGQLTLEQVIEDEDSFFKILNEREISTVLISKGQYFLRTSGNETKRLRNEYNERCPLIDGKAESNLNSIKNKISALDSLKIKVFSETVSEITVRLTNERFIEWVKTQSDAGVISATGDHEQLHFIFFLLSNGYLSTDYMSYRSIFMAGGLSESDNSFLKAVMAGKDPEKTFLFHLDKVKNVIDRLRKLGVLQRENAQHPAVTSWLLDHDTPTLKKNIEGLLGIIEGERSLSLLEMIQKDWAPEQRLRYLTLFVSHEDLLVKLVMLLCDYTHLTVVQEITACLFSLQTSGTRLKKSVNVHQIRKLFSDQINLLNNLPVGYGDIFVNNIQVMNIHLPHIPLASNEEQRVCIHNIVSKGLFSYSDVNIENICRSLTMDTNVSWEEFARHPLMLIESLQIPALDAVLQANIGAFISAVFINSAEIDRIPQLLNSPDVSLAAAELIISRMDFCVKELDQVINRAEVPDDNDSGAGRNIYSMLLLHDRISPSFDNFVHLLHDEAIATAHELVQWVNDKYLELTPCNIITSAEAFDKFLVKFIGSPVLSEEALLTVLKCFSAVITEIPKTIPLRNAELLFLRGKLAPTINVFTGLYNELNGDENNKKRMNILLSNLIALRSELLSEEPEEIFYVEGEFDAGLAHELFSHQQISINIKVGALRWLRDNEPVLFDKHHFLSLRLLAELSPWMNEDALRLQLLRICLISGEADKDTLRVVLDSFADEHYHGLLPQERFRKIPYTVDLWEMAELLSQTGLVHPPKMGSGRDEHKIVINPVRHNHEEESDD